MTENIEQEAVEEAESIPYEKADFLERFLAKLIDFIIAGALFYIPTPVGPVAALTYILISDGFKGGNSPGKRLIGLKVISLAREGVPCDFRESILRNLPLGILILAYLVIGWIPYVGVFSVVLVGLAVVAYEAMLVYNDEKGIRFGDRIAETMVIKAG
jgi:uncharacterized RDD family membrane protein YckC